MLLVCALMQHFSFSTLVSPLPAVVVVVLFLVVRKRRTARQAAGTAWETTTNSKDEDKVEEQANTDSMLDTFVTMHSGDESLPGGGGSLVGAAGVPTAPATPSIGVAFLGTAQPANHERPAGLPADYRTLDRQGRCSASRSCHHGQRVRFGTVWQI